MNNVKKGFNGEIREIGNARETDIPIIDAMRGYHERPLAPYSSGAVCYKAEKIAMGGVCL